ncbi:acetyl-CoA carboxylase biotin carboxyl carrier protein [Allocatelliglobosispora scoriae]|uniref:Biotin carboxyl carrier protein of acetyl-CoA carboxylase n=1 Tax=Allocatelliglobosispora scoriae TaxID=643052 RepID=A0A841BXG6_9ACTN|nr:biotin/lipoyl-containing protein [Allocatelliglobosispora scoriae]MBB5872854.1 acetyl-CoA carboxylase biotin carboxyl carrier protein [Allocatelliglobosispora scoriae]
MTEVVEPVRVDPDTGTHQLARALSDARCSAQEFLAGLENQPRTLRIRASDVVVEFEWGQTPPDPDWTPTAAKESIPAVAEAPCPGGGVLDICSPTVGTFFRAPQPGAAPFVAEGDRVRRGQQVGIVEAMKLMIPVEAELDGQVVAVLVGDGSSVEFGERLFAVEPVANPTPTAAGQA